MSLQCEIIKACQPTCAAREWRWTHYFPRLCKDVKADFVCYSGGGHFVCSQCEVIMLGFMSYDSM